jgi:hypothetical protein
MALLATALLAPLAAHARKLPSPTCGMTRPSAIGASFGLQAGLEQSEAVLLS